MKVASTELLTEALPKKGTERYTFPSLDISSCRAQLLISMSSVFKVDEVETKQNVSCTYRSNHSSRRGQIYDLQLH